MFSSALDGTRQFEQWLFRFDLCTGAFGILCDLFSRIIYIYININSVYVIESREDKITLWSFFKSVK